MAYYFLAFCCLFMLGCGQSTTNIDQKTDSLQADNKIVTDTIISPYPDTLSLGINFEPIGNYASLKNEIAAQRMQFRNQFVNSSEEEKQEVIDSASQYIYNQLLNGIFLFGMKPIGILTDIAQNQNQGVLPADILYPPHFCMSVLTLTVTPWHSKVRLMKHAFLSRKKNC